MRKLFSALPSLFKWKLFWNILLSDAENNQPCNLIATREILLHVITCKKLNIFWHVFKCSVQTNPMLGRLSTSTPKFLLIFLYRTEEIKSSWNQQIVSEKSIVLQNHSCKKNTNSGYTQINKAICIKSHW